jgi:hypothetical protein
VNEWNLYDEAERLGLEMDSHYSDLYLKCTEEAQALIQRHIKEGRATPSTFVSQIDSRLWWDVPFAYLPYWRARS